MHTEIKQGSIWAVSATNHSPANVQVKRYASAISESNLDRSMVQSPQSAGPNLAVKATFPPPPTASMSAQWPTDQTVVCAGQFPGVSMWNCVSAEPESSQKIGFRKLTVKVFPKWSTVDIHLSLQINILLQLRPAVLTLVVCIRFFCTLWDYNRNVW